MSSGIYRGCVVIAWLCLAACTAFSDLPASLESDDVGASDVAPADVVESDDALGDITEEEPDLPLPPTCGEGTLLCDGECVGITSINHCGGCDPCADASRSVPEACIEGECVYGCEQGFVDLNEDRHLGPEGDGCECQPVEELCDGVDNDCDSQIDEGVTNTCGGCGDLDGVPDEPCGECGVFVCDGDGGLRCEDVLRTFYADDDGDGFGQEDRSQLQCLPSEAFPVLEGGDCDDDEPTISPGAVEVCNGRDDNCNGVADDESEGVGEPCFLTRCGRGLTVCESGRVRCDIEPVEVGTLDTLPVEGEGFIRTYTGTDRPLMNSHSVHLSSNGEKLYNVAFGIDGEPFAGWTVRVFRPEVDRVAFIREVTIPVGDMGSEAFAGVAAIGDGILLAFNLALPQSSGGVWRVDLNREAATSFFSWDGRSSSEGSAEYDWVRDRLWTVSFGQEPSTAFRYEPPDNLSRHEIFNLDEPAGTEGVIASDGRYIYTAPYSVNETGRLENLRRGDTHETREVNTIATEVIGTVPPIASLTFHSDGYLYMPDQRDLTRVYRMAVTVGVFEEVCDGVDNDCDGFTDNLRICDD